MQRSTNNWFCILWRRQKFNIRFVSHLLTLAPCTGLQAMREHIDYPADNTASQPVLSLLHVTTVQCYCAVNRNKVERAPVDPSTDNSQNSQTISLDKWLTSLLRRAHDEPGQLMRLANISQLILAYHAKRAIS